MRRLIPLLWLAFVVMACQDDGPTVPVNDLDLAKGGVPGPPDKPPDDGSREKTFAFLFPSSPTDAENGVYWSQDKTYYDEGGPAGVDCQGPVLEDRTDIVGPGPERYMLCPNESSPVFVLRVEDSNGNGVNDGTFSFEYCADSDNNPSPGATCCCRGYWKRGYQRLSLTGEFLGEGYFSVTLPGQWPRYDYEEAIGVSMSYDADNKGQAEHVKKWYEFVSGFVRP